MSESTIGLVNFMLIDETEAIELQQLCDKPGGAPKNTTVFDEETVFLDGNRMAIQVCTPSFTPEDTCWTQGVLFHAEGTELGCTEVGDTLLGEYRVDYEDVSYRVHVMSKPQVTNE